MFITIFIASPLVKSLGWKLLDVLALSCSLFSFVHPSAVCQAELNLKDRLEQFDLSSP